MTVRYSRSKMRSTLLAAACALALPSAAWSETINLKSRSTVERMPDGRMVEMWGLCEETGTPLACSETAFAPPVIRVPAGDLTINLVNELPVSTSVVIPGQIADSFQPQFDVDAQGRQRVRSFTAEALGGGSQSYGWTGLRPGTYLIQSGSQPSVQVQMGLYAVLVVEETAGGTAADVVLLYSEVDADMHDGVVCKADAACNPVDPLPSTLDYSPRYFLVNGAPFDARYPQRSTYSVMAPGPVRLRLANAGQTTRIPALGDGLELTIVAEDGFPLPSPRTQASAVLPAGKTLDVDVPLPGLAANYPVYDRMLGLTTNNQPEGGMLVYLAASYATGDGSDEPAPIPAAPPLAAFDDTLTVNGSTGSSIQTASVLANDPDSAGAVAEQLASDVDFLTLAADGTFSFTMPGRGGEAHVVYRYCVAGDPPLCSNQATATLLVTLNGPPVAVADSYRNVKVGGLEIAAPGVLANDRDPDGEELTAQIEGTAPAGLSLAPDGSFSYTGTTSASFDYRACAGAVCSTVPATVTLDISNVSGPTLSVLGVDPEKPGLGATPVVAYRWVLEQDRMFHPETAPALPVGSDGSVDWVAAASACPGGGTPGVDCPEGGYLNTVQALSFHPSYMPVVAQGCVGAGCPAEELLSLDEAALHAAGTGPTHYYVSVMPLCQEEIDENGDPVQVCGTVALQKGGTTSYGYDMGGGPIAPGQETATVTVNRQPTPSAQISVLVFEDNQPTNGAADLDEAELGGFQINLEDAGGRYGASGAHMIYDKDGELLTNALCPGPDPGIILTCADGPNAGKALIRNLPPGKFGVIVIPPADQKDKWIQTSTIEGTRIIDAWVKGKEPRFFQEFGPPGYHAFVGFMRTDATPPPSATGDNVVTGFVTNLRMSRPPDQTLTPTGSHVAMAHTAPRVGVNLGGGVGPNYWSVQADPESGEFRIEGIPDGVHQLVVWDDYLDQIIASRQLCVPAGPGCEGGDVGNVPVFTWFTRLEHFVFEDKDDSGTREAGEEGMLEQAVNLRWRDGTIFQSFPTDLTGFVPFDQTFPFFHWQVMEVDFGRHMATGATFVVDAGGPATGETGVDFDGDGNASEGVDVYSAQLQPENGNLPYRTEHGPILTEAFQGFIGQTSAAAWGKRPYRQGENGGISGIVYYATTRAENDPRLAAAEVWEPGVAGVKVRLYRKLPSGGEELVAETVTDSWDATPPSGCPGNDSPDLGGLDAALDDRCYDGLRNFNQVRPGVFDGGFAFGLTDNPAERLPPGTYVVEVVPPPGYQVIREEDRNVDFGAVSPAVVVLPDGSQVAVAPDPADVQALAQEKTWGIAAPRCVGDYRTVPQTLSFYGGGDAPPEVDAPFAGYDRPLCNRKEVVLEDRANAAAEFFLFTQAPIASHVVGMILDDTAVEFDPDSPNFGEKWAPPNLPISFKDWTGRELSRIVSDPWGRFSALVPSTFTANVGMPSGMSPNMVTSCMNDGVRPDGSLDLNYDPRYSTFCYTLQFMPGTTTYLDTPVLPVSAYAAGDEPVDCALPNGTPRISEVVGGPWVAEGAGQITLRSMGDLQVPNPAYQGPLGSEPRTIARDYGFGDTAGTVELGNLQLVVDSWGAAEITASMPNLACAECTPAYPAAGDYQLHVRRPDGTRSITGITLTVGGAAPVHVNAGASIQAAIDAASPGDLIVVGPGQFEELLIVDRPVRLQGSGEATIINAAKRPTEKLEVWRQKLQASFEAGHWSPLPGQEVTFADPAVLELEPAVLVTEEGAGITVLGLDCRGLNGQAAQGCFDRNPSRIDGFSITGGDTGGGIFVNGWADRLQISNNRVYGNSGFFHGGIRVGRPDLETADDPSVAYNDRVVIRNNAVTQNSASDGAGAGISICSGSQQYRIDGNWICGNFSQGDGAGIGHLGLSDDGRITNNTVIFNQSFNQGQNRNGGGIFIGGRANAGLTLGAGTVRVEANLIQGNQAAAGRGGGLRTQLVNGAELLGGSPSATQALNTRAYRVYATNNIIVNNLAGGAGGGISLQDTVHARIRHNTIAHNDSTATTGDLYDPATNTTAAQPAGLVSEPHSPALQAALDSLNWPNAPGNPLNQGNRYFSQPLELINDVLWQNRSLHYEVVGGTPQLLGETDYDDLGVLGGAGDFAPSYSVLTSAADAALGPSNTTTAPLFVDAYFNTGRGLKNVLPETTTVPTVAPALDEGGNFIDVRFGPIEPAGDYHLSAACSGASCGAPGTPTDFDGETRTQYDRGADEVVGTGTAAAAATSGGVNGGAQQ